MWPHDCHQSHLLLVFSANLTLFPQSQLLNLSPAPTSSWRSGKRSTSSTHRLPRGNVERFGPCFAHQSILELDAGKGPSGHHGVVAPPRAVRVELPRGQPTGCQNTKYDDDDDDDCCHQREKKKMVDGQRHLLLSRYLAAALTRAMLPAGEMWSVVTLSPRNSRA